MLFWENEESINLLDLFEKREFLWNPNIAAYRNPDLKDKAWQEISNTLGREPDDCKRKIESLKSSYRGARNRRIRSGDINGHHRSFGYDIMNRIYKRIVAESKAKKASITSAMKRNANGTKKDLHNSTIEKTVKAESIESEEPQIVFSFEDDFTLDQMENVETVNVADVIINKSDDPLQTTENSPEKINKKVLDDCDAFAQYVSAKLRKLSDQQRAIVQHRVSNVFFEVEMSMYSNKEGI